jgi:hypothetical protein
MQEEREALLETQSHQVILKNIPAFETRVKASVNPDLMIQMSTLYLDQLRQ